MEKTNKENPMEEELSRLRKNHLNRTRVGMSEMLIQMARDIKPAESKFVSLEMKPRDFRFPHKKPIPKSAKDIFEELSNIIEKWKSLYLQRLEAGDKVGAFVLNDCVKDLYEIVHRNRKASGKNGLKKKKKNKE